MADKDFPSGPWTGFYQYQNGVRGKQDLRLTFARGRMTGAGADEVGQFIIEGSYDSDTNEARWVKYYPGGHSIDYRGFRDGPVKGIWGTWKISASWHGGFHIWPLESLDESRAQEVADDKFTDDPLIREALERLKAAISGVSRALPAN